MIKAQTPGSRPLTALALGLVLLSGLLLRSHLVHLPAFAVKYGGDALWALAVLLGLRFIFIRSTPAAVGILAFAGSCAVEFSQLYHAPWIDALRATRLGALALGSTFNWPDIAAYAVGALLGTATLGMAAGLKWRR